MKRILFVGHNESDGSSLTWDFMRFHGVELETVKPLPGFAMPKDPSGFDGIVTMGYPATAPDAGFMDAEVALLQSALEKNTPILAVSLGARMLARACEASPQDEVAFSLGWSRVKLTLEGRKDILFFGLPASMSFFHVSDKIPAMPQGALHLAGSDEWPIQAFRYRNAYGLYFHIDVTPAMLGEWTKMTHQRERSIRYFEARSIDLTRQARSIYGNFLWLIDICGEENKERKRRGGVL